MREWMKRLAPAPLVRLYRMCRMLWIRLLCVGYRIYPIVPNRIVLCNVWGYGDNAKYVAEELLREKVPFELIFITNHPEAGNVPEGIKVLKSNTCAAVKALATARVWVDNNRKEAYILKRKGQYYIQTWHGGISLKRIEGDCRELLGEEYIKNAQRDSAMTDLYVSNSRFCTNMYRSAFWYRGEILECGSPRNDGLFFPDPEVIRAVREKLGVAEDVHLAIYAPTYRGAGRKGKEAASIYALDTTGLRATLSDRFGGEWVILIRLHPMAAEDSRYISFGEAVIDASRYRDLYELLQAGEVLITDYSNTMFEFAMSGNPVFLYAKDVREYQRERGFYFDYYTLPFTHAATGEELFANIRSYSGAEYRKETSEFFRTMEIYEDGHGAERVAERIRRVMAQ